MSDGAENEGVRAGVVSVVSFGLMVLLLVVRGASDWSEAFAVLWYGLWVTALVFALVAIFAAARRGVPLGRRLLGAALGITTLGLSGLLVMVILATLSRVS